ncbi:hypothetical protein QE450_002305 [Paenibacillus sp. SORGH_AS306]|nr:hypothetical protein [Paenibacillus sp. SORGH_AS_0306]MDR6111854.1 hypothetical protein [Paenibacillus sp. SORGH_AS_0338]
MIWFIQLIQVEQSGKKAWLTDILLTSKLLLLTG